MRQFPEMRRRLSKPWQAFVVSLAMPGLGQISSGATLRGLAWLLGLQLFYLGYLFQAILWMPPGPIAIVGFLALVALLRLACACDAWKWLRSRSAEERKTPLSLTAISLQLAILALFILVQVRSIPIPPGLVHTFWIPGDAMQPTLNRGEYLLCDTAPRSPQRGEILICNSPDSNTREKSLLAFRLIASAGQTVEIRSGQLLIDNQPQIEPYLQRTAGDNFGPLTIPPGQLFLMGDNRDDSYDCRFRGPIPSDCVLGRADRIFWSKDWDRIGRSLLPPHQ